MNLTKEQIGYLKSTIHEYIFEWVGEDNLVFLTKDIQTPIPQKTGEPHIINNTDIVLSVDEPRHLDPKYYDKYLYLEDFDLAMVINKILSRILKSKAKSIYMELNHDDLTIRITLDDKPIPTIDD